jgi:hypothetical protein
MNISKTIDNNSINENQQERNIKYSNKIFDEIMNDIKYRNPMQEINISKGTEIKEKNLKLTQLKFSVFDKDYDPKKYKAIIKKVEKDKNKEEEEKINKFKEKDYLSQFQKQQRQIELTRRDEIAVIHKNIILNKLKKKNL